MWLRRYKKGSKISLISQKRGGRARGREAEGRAGGRQGGLDQGGRIEEGTENGNPVRRMPSCFPKGPYFCIFFGLFYPLPFLVTVTYALPFGDPLPPLNEADVICIAPRPPTAFRICEWKLVPHENSFEVQHNPCQEITPDLINIQGSHDEGAVSGRAARGGEEKAEQVTDSVTLDIEADPLPRFPAGPFNININSPSRV